MSAEIRRDILELEKLRQDTETELAHRQHLWRARKILGARGQAEPGSKLHRGGRHRGEYHGRDHRCAGDAAMTRQRIRLRDLRYYLLTGLLFSGINGFAFGPKLIRSFEGQTQLLRY